jgi:phosphonate transport system substrate-binding protein
VSHGLAISPDVHVRDLGDWFVLGSRLHRGTGEVFRVTAYDDVDELHRAYRSGAVDLVLANAADAAVLVRELGFRCLLRPRGVRDEAAVVVAHEASWACVEHLTGPLTVAATDAPDVDRICRILLEPADLGVADLPVLRRRNHVLVAKAVLTGKAQVGFFPKAAFDDLSPGVRAGLRELISSRIHVVSHCLLAGPAIAVLDDAVVTTLEQLDDPRLLAGLGAPHGWERMTSDDVHFMIDLMDALTG